MKRMQVQVRLYGPFSLMSGRREFPLETEGDEMEVGDFLDHLAGKLPQLKGALNAADREAFLKQKILLVVNGMPCAETSRLLHDGDRVQVLTPVSGG